MHSLRHSIRLWRAAALLAVAALLLAACGGAAPASPAPSADTPTAGASTQENNLVVLEWAGYELPEFYEPFTEQHPQVELDYSFFS